MLTNICCGEMPSEKAGNFAFFLLLFFEISFCELIANGMELIRYRFQAIVYTNR